MFQCLIGNKLGPAPLPLQLEEAEYQHIHLEVFEAGKGECMHIYTLQTT